HAKVRILLPQPAFLYEAYARLAINAKLLSRPRIGRTGQQLFLFNASESIPFIMAQDRFMIFTGTANPRLAVDVVNHLDMS
ncbi:MAG TPA: hypothetical protein DEB15_10180, partial [Pusillimonas sp.]|nr:hypothetical protein [Pusillimonas sp.]